MIKSRNKRGFMDHTRRNDSNDQPAKIKRALEDNFSPYFEEIESILERRIEEIKASCSPSCNFKPAQAGHWIFVR